jgi:hypothetical protein
MTEKYILLHPQYEIFIAFWTLFLPAAFHTYTQWYQSLIVSSLWFCGAISLWYGEILMGVLFLFLFLKKI